MTFNELRNKTSLAIKKQWPKIITATIISMGCSIFFFLSVYITFYIVNIIFEGGFVLDGLRIISLFIVPIILLIVYSILVPMLLGMKKFISNVALGNFVTLKDLFYYYDANFKYKKLWSLYINIFLRKFILFIIFLLPPLTLTFILAFLPENLGLKGGEGNYILYLVVSIFFIFIGYIIFSYFNTKHYIVITLFLANPHMSIKTIMKLSKKVSKKYQSEIVMKTISKIPLYICCFTIIPVFLIYPNIIVSDSIYANFLITDYRKAIIR